MAIKQPNKSKSIICRACLLQDIRKPSSRALLNYVDKENILKSTLILGKVVDLTKPKHNFQVRNLGMATSNSASCTLNDFNNDTLIESMFTNDIDENSRKSLEQTNKNMINFAGSSIRTYRRHEDDTRHQLINDVGCTPQMKFKTAKIKKLKLSASNANRNGQEKARKFKNYVTKSVSKSLKYVSGSFDKKLSKFEKSKNFIKNSKYNCNHNPNLHHQNQILTQKLKDLTFEKETLKTALCQQNTDISNVMEMAINKVIELQMQIGCLKNDLEESKRVGHGNSRSPSTPGDSLGFFGWFINLLHDLLFYVKWSDFFKNPFLPVQSILPPSYLPPTLDISRRVNYLNLKSLDLKYKPRQVRSSNAGLNDIAVIRSNYEV